MAQIAIPLLLIGSAYLISNNNKEKEEKEGFSELTEVTEERQSNLLANENKDFYPNISKTNLNTNNKQEISQYQDKYFLNNQQQIPEENMYETLAGNKIKTSDLNHNNMNIYYNNKTNGYTNLDSNNVLDTYTGQGTYNIKKEEVASLFKPESNTQNVYGNQNKNDFYQSRVNPSLRHANTKPWEEIKDTPGLNMAYDENNANLGYNNYNMQRDTWTPKNVDELRTANNPKLVYGLENHMGPAINPITNRGILGKTIKKTPEGFFANDNNLGMVGGAANAKATMRHSEQMMTDENRAHTSVSYYGVKGPGVDQASYIDGEYMDPHKQQLSQTPIINMSNNNQVNPANTLNYSKDSYTSLPNNRNTTKDNYFGNIGGIVANVVEPLVNTLRHSKKTNITSNTHMGSMNGGHKQPIVYNPNDNVTTTNREMYECKLGLNHLNVQKQDGTAYMNTRPVLNDTSRSTMNQSETGPAMSTSQKGNKNYNAEYNQRNKNKVVACDVKSGGNMSLFNNKVKITDYNKEHCNNRQTPFYNPVQSNFDHPSNILGQFTNMPQEYENTSNNYIDESLLNAFKSNPYTQSLKSAV